MISLFSLKFRFVWLLFRMRAVVVIVWLLAGSCGSPYLFFYATVSIPSIDGELFYCLPIYEVNMAAFVTCNFLLFYIIPLILMTVLYTKISIVLWRSSKQGNIEKDVSGRNNTSKHEEKPISCSKGIQLVLKRKTTKKQKRDNEYNAVPNIVVISAAPVASRENSPEAMRKFASSHAVPDVHSGVNKAGSVCESPVRNNIAPSAPPPPYNADGQVVVVHYPFTEDALESGRKHEHENSIPGSSGTKAGEDGENVSLREKLDSISSNSSCRSNQSRKNSLTVKPVATHAVRTISNNRQEPKKKEGGLMARRKVIRLLMAVLISFSICVFPYHLRVMYQTWSKPEISFQGMLMVPITFVVYYTNSGLNPILYAFLSDNFRKSLKEVITCSVKRSRPVFSLRNGGSVRAANSSV